MLNEIHNSSLSNREKLELSRLKAAKWAEKQMLLSAKKKTKKASASVVDKKIDDDANKENDSIGNFGIADNKVLSNKERLALSRAKANRWAKTQFMDSTKKKKIQNERSTIESEEEDDEVANENVDESVDTVARKVNFDETGNANEIFIENDKEIESEADDDEGRDESVDDVARKVNFDEIGKTNEVVIENDKEKIAEGVAINSLGPYFVLMPIIVFFISLIIIVLEEDETFQEHFPVPLLKLASIIKEFASNLMTGVFPESHKNADSK